MSSDFALSIFALCLSVASAVWSAVNIMRQPDEPDDLLERAEQVDEELDEIERHLVSLERRVTTLKSQRDEVEQ